MVDGAFTYANRSFLDMTGYSASQLPLVGIGELIRAHEGGEAELSLFLAGLVPDAVPDTPAPRPLACQLSRREGEPVDAVLGASSFSVAGRGGWILAVKRVTTLLAERRESSFDDAAPIGMFRARWGRRTPLVEVNEAARRMLGLTGDAAEADLFDPLGDPEEADRLRRELAAGAHLDRHELQLPAPGGDGRTVLLSAVLGPVQSDGSRSVEGFLEDVTAGRNADRLFDDILLRFESAEGLAEIAGVWGRLPEMVESLLDSGAGLRTVNRRITLVSDVVIGRLVRLAIEELGRPPAAFAYLVLGSDGREEQTLGSDQDSAIVYGDGAPGDPDASHAWFHSLGTRVCGWLEAMGVPPCVGRMMASNPRWCAPLSEWEAMFDRWITEPEPRELMDFQVFFDFRAVHGDKALAARLRRFIAEKLGGEPPFFLHLARDALQRKPPALFEGGMLRDLRRTGTPTLGLKDAMIPFVSFARLYALRHGVEATNTLARLESLRDCGVLKPPFYRECARAYTFLAEARLRRQVGSVRGRASSEDVIEPDRLGRAGDAMLRRAAEQAALLQKRTSFDFLGSAL